jgi:hypothetical protein
MGPAPARCHALPAELRRVPCAAGPRREAACGARAVRARGAAGGRACAARALRLESAVRLIYLVTLVVLNRDGSDTAALEKEYKHNVRWLSPPRTWSHAYPLDRPYSKPKSSRSSAPRPPPVIRGDAEQRKALSSDAPAPRPHDNASRRIFPNPAARGHSDAARQLNAASAEFGVNLVPRPEVAEATISV